MTEASDLISYIQMLAVSLLVNVVAIAIINGVVYVGYDYEKYKRSKLGILLYRKKKTPSASELIARMKEIEDIADRESRVPSFLMGRKDQ